MAIQVDSPAKLTGQELVQAAHDQFRADFREAAESMERVLSPGWRVTYGKHWKGYGLTLYLPPVMPKSGKTYPKPPGRNSVPNK